MISRLQMANFALVALLAACSVGNAMKGDQPQVDVPYCVKKVMEIAAKKAPERRMLVKDHGISEACRACDEHGRQPCKIC